MTGRGQKVSTMLREPHRGCAVKLTTARYFTPNGRSIQAKGIVPDINLKPLKIEVSESKHGASFSEKDLNGRLSNPNGEASETDEEPDDQDNSEKLAETDYQLFEALNLLKGLYILNQQNNS